MKESRLESLEIKMILAIGVLLAVLASAPYLIGYMDCPDNGKFLWMTFNSDDFCVYLSWTRQVADGQMLMRNLFTNETQPAMQFNLFFTLAGLLARFTGLSPLAVLHLLRVVLAIVLVWAIWRLSRLFFDDARERITVAALVAFSSGFGWMFADTKYTQSLPVDRWQPESLLFLSAYLNPLFLMALLLMVGVMHNLVQVHKTGKVRNAIWAGLLLLALGNVHTYDLASLGLGWGTYLLYLLAVRDRGVFRTLILSATAGVTALPSVLYQFHVYHSDRVFQLRANTPAGSPALWCYFLGYGLVFVLALVGAKLAVKRRDHLLLVIWAAACFTSAYLPFAQQRKFIMGLQIPLVMLAVFAFSALLKRMSWKNWVYYSFLLVLCAMPMNSAFLGRDMHWLKENRTAPTLRPYIADYEWRSLGWIRKHVKPGESILCGPDPGAYIPAFAGRNIYCGHWSETPDFGKKVNEWLDFMNPEASDEWLKDLLYSKKITYVWYQDFTDDPYLANVNVLPTLDGKPFLVPVHRDGRVVIYKVR